MPKIHELDADQKERALKSYGDHAEVLREQQIAAANEAQKLLWATNAGAAVALMAFMGAKDVIRESPDAWTSLWSFFIGIVALAALRAVNYHTMLRIFSGWIDTTRQAIDGKIDVNVPREWVNVQANKRKWLPQLLAYVSLACFLFGCIWAATHLPQLAKAQSATEVVAQAAMPAVATPSTVQDQSWWWKLVHDPNATFSGAVALFTFALVLVGVVQARQLRRTVEATREAAQALPNIERAYVFVRVFMIDGPVLTDDGSGQSELKVEFANHGRTPAILEQINAVAQTAMEIPTELIDPAITQLPPGLVIPPGESYDLQVRYRITRLEWNNVTGANLALFCYGRLRYRDVLNNHRETRFCWNYQHGDHFRNFQITPDTPMNRWT